MANNFSLKENNWFDRLRRKLQLFSNSKCISPGGTDKPSKTGETTEEAFAFYGNNGLLKNFLQLLIWVSSLGSGYRLQFKELIFTTSDSNAGVPPSFVKLAPSWQKTQSISYLLVISSTISYLKEITAVLSSWTCDYSPTEVLPAFSWEKLPLLTGRFGLLAIKGQNGVVHRLTMTLNLC